MKVSGLLLLLFVMGCADPVKIGPPETVRVVTLECEPKWGLPDCSTWVQFPDGTRAERQGQAGSVGDSFTAHRVTFGTEVTWR